MYVSVGKFRQALLLSYVGIERSIGKILEKLFVEEHLCCFQLNRRMRVLSATNCVLHYYIYTLNEKYRCMLHV